jgi:hypothetical protein
MAQADYDSRTNFVPDAPKSNVSPSPTPDTVPPAITTGDLQVFRQIAAERNSLIKENAQLKTDVEKAEASAQKWQKHSEAETYRADVVQEKRIGEIQTAYNEKSAALDVANKQIAEFTVQHAADRQYVADLQFSNRKLKGDRWRWGLTGLATGSAAGFAGGYYVGSKSKDTNILFGSKGGLADNKIVAFQF